MINVRDALGHWSNENLDFRERRRFNGQPDLYTPLLLAVVNVRVAIGDRMVEILEREL